MRQLVLQKLSLLPVDYLPDDALHLLISAMLLIANHLPDTTTTSTSSNVSGASSVSDDNFAFIAEWCKLVYSFVCHVEDGSMARSLGQDLASFLLCHLLQLRQGKGWR